MIKPRVTGQIRADQQATILVFGASGTGKTVLAATLPGPVVLLDAEKGEGSVSLDAAGIEVTSIGVSSYREMKEALAWVSRNGKHFKSAVFDGLSTLEDSLYSDIAAQGGAAAKKSQPEVLAEAGYGILGAQHLAVREAFLRLPVQYKLMIAHSTVKDGVETPLVAGQQGRKAPVYATMVFNLKVIKQNGVLKRLFRTINDGSTLSKNRLGRLREHEPADFRVIFHKLGLPVLETPADNAREDARQLMMFPWAAYCAALNANGAETAEDNPEQETEQTEYIGDEPIEAPTEEAENV